MSINYEEIVNNLRDEDIIQLMYKLGADRHEERDNCIIFPTICHNDKAEEASMKLYYYKDNHFFYCFTSCSGMSIFKFLENYYNTRNYNFNWAKDVLKVAQNCSNYCNDLEQLERYKRVSDKYRRRPTIDLAAYSENVLDTFIKYYPPEWLNDNISKDAMDKFNILYSISQNKIVIPHYDMNDRLVGIRGRALNDSDIAYAKYAPIKVEDITYKHKLSLNLYGLNKNWENMFWYKTCFLAEGEKSVLQAESFSFPNITAAVCGSQINIYQIKLLLQYCQPEEIVICFDKEENPGEDIYFNKLWNMCSKYKNYTNISFIYDRENILDMKESPFDRGELAFKQLLDKRVRVR